jgi:hypothetical protein
MCLNETYSKARILKRVFDIFPIQNGIRNEELLYRQCLSSVLQYVP